MHNVVHRVSRLGALCPTERLESAVKCAPQCAGAAAGSHHARSQKTARNMWLLSMCARIYVAL